MAWGTLNCFDSGYLVNIFSHMANFRGHNLAAYVSAKGGVNALIFILARVLVYDVIRVNAFSKVVIATNEHQ